MNPRDNPIFKTVSIRASRLVWHRLERIVLFGSKARGDARMDSD